MSTEEITSIKDSLHRIEKAIIGDPQMGHRGLAERLTELEKRGDATDRKLLLWSGIVVGASTVIGHLKAKLFG